MASFNQASRKNKAIEEGLCSNCRSQTLNSDLKILPCLHSFCNSCLQRHVLRTLTGELSLSCPSCHRDVKLKGEGISALPSSSLIRDYFTEVVVCRSESLNTQSNSESSSVMPSSMLSWLSNKHSQSSPEFSHFGFGNSLLFECGACDEGETASFLCRHCDEYLCDHCTRAHQRVRLTREHQIVKLHHQGSSSTQPLHHDILKLQQHDSPDLPSSPVTVSNLIPGLSALSTGSTLGSALGPFNLGIGIATSQQRVSPQTFQNSLPKPSTTNLIPSLPSTTPSGGRSPVFCELHGREYSFFCKFCLIPVCRDCMNNDHNGHNIGYLNSLTSSASDNSNNETALRKLVTDSRVEIKAMEEALNGVKNMIDDVEKKTQGVANDVKATAKRHMAAIEERERELLRRVEKIRQVKGMYEYFVCISGLV